ncbi:MAG TPA: glycosyltransferase, partial [Elusimicrobiota bacterium]|nr:glycosyltransferase [Elusimicrobiota bacterium]
GYRVVHQKTKGITYAYQEALQHIETDVVIAFSPDGNSMAERIPALVEKMAEGYDMVIVSRYKDDAKSDDDDFFTGIGNWVFTKMINVLFGGNYTDSLVMFRGFKRDLVKQFPENIPRAGLETLLSIRCAKLKLKVGEIPGDEPERIGGKRKMQPILNGLDILRLIAIELFS